MTTPTTLAPLTSRLCLAHHWIKKPGEAPTHINEPLTEPRIAAHLTDGYGAGACPITPGESTTRCAVLDMDSHKGEVDWVSMQLIAREIINALAESNLRAIPFRSSGGSGVHLVMLWKEPQDAFSVREALRIALAKCNFTSGTGGVAKREVEIFPKQDAVPRDGFGSMFVLPLHGKSCALLPDTLADTVPAVIKWAASDPVEQRERPVIERPTVITTAETTLIKSALDAIPNSGECELPYDAWRNVVFAVHSATEGSDDGLALVHEFSARSSKYDPEFLDTRVWPYVRDERENAITVRSLYSAASVYGWVDPTTIDDFEVLAPGSSDPFTPSPEVSTSAGATRFKALTVSEFTAGKSPPWIIKGVIPKAALAVIFGESTAGKTFFALDVIAAVARGEPWRGRRVEQGRGVYICAEGVTGFRNRVRAYLHEHQLDDLDLRVIAEAPNFMEVDDVKAVISQVKGCGPVSIVVVDTLARAITGADENSAQDMGRAIYHCEQLHRVTGALVVLIHHSGKDASKGARGSGALRAAADCEIEVSRCDDDRVAMVTKLKDGEDGTEFGFKLHTVVVDIDDDGDDVTSCVIEHTTAVKADKKGRAPSGEWVDAIKEHYGQLVTDLGTNLIDDLALVGAIKEANGHRRNTHQKVMEFIAKLVSFGYFTRVGDAVTTAGGADAGDSLV